ncbi:ABC transporter permease [Clostridium tyrobutyricum]|nr:ABC transporter permease [Clostridium tyrobutyricum]MBV4428432.1 ABC transporter permease [Clostridium tyrobutyricum]MBV4443362.1 ABC transporter permease [Clostridium tyrobutyricum]
MLNYLLKNYESMGKLLEEHLYIVSLTLALSLIIAIPISILILRSKLLSNSILAIFGAIYSIPSLALFALLVPLIGLGKKPAIFVLVVYNQYILVRNVLAGFNSIDSSIIEAARGLGLSKSQLFFKIQLPLAFPIILGGIRISAVVTIGIATIAAVINAGGLGVILFDGLRMNYLPKILWGTIMSAALAFLANQIILYFEKRASLKSKGEFKNNLYLGK